MPRYIKKPIIIEAKQLTHTPESLEEICNWMKDVDYAVAVNDTHAILIPTLEGTMTANVGDWVIKGVKGEFYPCKPEIFEATYDLVENCAATLETASTETTV